MRKEGGLDLIKKAIGKLEVSINNTLQLMVKATRGVSPRTMKPQTSTNYLGYEIKLIVCGIVICIYKLLDMIRFG